MPVEGTNERWAFSIRAGSDEVCMKLRGESCTNMPVGTQPLEGLSGSSGSDGGDAYTCVYGIVSLQVGKVDVLFDDGHEMPARVFEGTGWHVDFFAMCRGDDDAAVKSIDLMEADGTLLETYSPPN